MGELFRYPGPVPFRKEQALQFFGRDHDAEQLYNQVLLNACVVLVGKSGVGKSSLISAGLLPRIDQQINQRRGDSRNMRVVQIVLQAYNPADNATLVDRLRSFVIATLGHASDQAQHFLSFLPATDRQSINFLLKVYQLDGYLSGRKELFLFIFDQLEQLYSYPVAQVEALEHELQELINPNVPDSLREHMERAMDSDAQLLKDYEVAMLETPVNIKFLFAIRSDRLSLLIRLRSAIPDLLHNPYELKPMDRRQAAKAIEEPARAVNPQFAIDPFQFHESTVQKICEFIEQLPNNELEYRFYEGKIEPIIIQIICRYVEENIAPYDNDRILQADEIDLQQILDRYYDTCVESLNLHANELEKVRVLIEEKLIYEPDKRRLNYYEGVIRNEFKVARKVLDQLSEKGLLRCITTAGVDATFEIAHDWLVLPILNARQRRKTKESTPEDKYLLGLNERIGHSKSDSTLVLERAEYHLAQGRIDDAVNDFTLVLSMLPEKSAPVLIRRSIAYSTGRRYKEAIQDLLSAEAIDPANANVHLQLGINYYSLNKYDDAKKYFLDHLDRYPASADVYNYLGIIAKAELHPEEAFAYFEKVLQMNPEHQLALYNLGVLHYDKAAYELSRQDFERALALPAEFRTAHDDSHCYNYLGLLSCVPDNNLKSGEPFFRKAVEAMSTNSHAWYNLGIIAFDDANWEESLHSFSQVAENTGMYAQAQNYLGRIYSERKFSGFDLERAFKYFLKALQLNTSNEIYMYNLGWVAYQLEDWNLAKEWFEKSVMANPDNAESFNYLGLIAEKQEGQDAAIAIYKSALASIPNNRMLLFNLGRNYYDKGLLDEAKIQMQKVYELYPQYADSQNYLGLIAKQQGNTIEAHEWFAKSIGADPDYHYPLYNKGVLYYEAGEYEQSKECFNKVLQLDPDHLHAYNYLGLIAEFTNQLEEAVLNYKKVVELDPDYAIGYYNLGIALYSLNRLEEASNAFKEAIKLNHQPGVCYNYLGAIAYNQGDKEAAIGFYNESLAQIPDYEYALYNLGECYYQYGQFEQSLSFWIRLEQQRPDDWEVIWFKARCYNQLHQQENLVATNAQLHSMKDLVPADKMELLQKEMAETVH